jgi:hypothetical protein
VITLIALLQPVTATPNWAEDFSDDTLAEWDLFGVNRTEETVTWFDHTWEITDGELVTTGTYDSTKKEVFNLACRPLGYSKGTWSVDYFAPTMTQDAVTGGFGVSNRLADRLENRSDPSIEFFMIQFIQASDLLIQLIITDDTSYQELVGIQNTVEGGYLGWHNYKFVRDDDNFTVYIDDSMLFQVDSYLDRIGNLENLCLLGKFGVHSKFDNVYTYDPSYTSDSSSVSGSSSTDDVPTNLLFAGAAIAAITLISFGSARYVKKKETP